MPLLLRKGREADLNRIVTVQNATFDGDPLMQILFPGQRSTDAIAKALKLYGKDMEDPRITFMTVVDTDDDDRIIGFAKWHIYKRERAEEEWAKEEKREWGDGTNVAAADELIGGIFEKRRRIMAGKPHCLLNILDVHPDSQRRGAGRMLVDWGTKVGDEAGIPCYLEGTPAGYHLYKQSGFKDVEVLDMDLTKWGGKGIHRHICMIRPAKDH